MQYRVCKTCQILKPLSEYYNRHTECKLCNTNRSKLWRRNNPDRAKANSKIYNDSHKERHALLERIRRKNIKDKVREINKRQYDKNRDIRVAKSRLYRSEYPERERAHNIFKSALRSGKVIRPNKCDNCGETCRPHGHHSDYNYPLDVKWLCNSCHRLVHIGKYQAALDCGITLREE